MAHFSEPNLSELYNIVTFRNYWNFLHEDISLDDFKKKQEFSEMYFQDSQPEPEETVETKKQTDKNDSLDNSMSKMGADNYQNITFVMDENYFDRIRVNRC